MAEFQAQGGVLRRCAVTAFQPGSVTVFQYGLLVHVVSVHARSGRTDTAMSSACPGLGGCIPERQRLVTRAPKHMGLTRHGPSSVHRACADVVHTLTRRGHCTSGCSVLYTSVLGRLLPHRCSPHRVVLYRPPPPLSDPPDDPRTAARAQVAWWCGSTLRHSA